MVELNNLSNIRSKLRSRVKGLTPRLLATGDLLLTLDKTETVKDLYVEIILRTLCGENSFSLLIDR